MLYPFETRFEFPFTLINISCYSTTRPERVVSHVKKKVSYFVFMIVLFLALSSMDDKYNGSVPEKNTNELEATSVFLLENKTKWIYIMQINKLHQL